MSDPIITDNARCLLAAAAPKELAAIGVAFDHDLTDVSHHDPITLDTRFDAVLTGVGKSCAAASVARALTLNPYASVISVGVAGSLPSEDPPRIGSSIAATRSVFADEGVGTPGGFTPLSEMGFAPFPNKSDSIEHDAALIALLSAVCDGSGPIATVSWCSGDDACAAGVVRRTGAIAEAMEGAACALAAKRAGDHIMTSELRVISNTTGNRDAQVWDLDVALGSLSKTLSVLAAK